jgi:hypothetical protein
MSCLRFNIKIINLLILIIERITQIRISCRSFKIPGSIERLITTQWQEYLNLKNEIEVQGAENSIRWAGTTNW